MNKHDFPHWSREKGSYYDTIEEYLMDHPEKMTQWAKKLHTKSVDLKVEAEKLSLTLSGSKPKHIRNHRRLGFFS